MPIGFLFADRAKKVLQNKVIDGGAADDQHRITLPKADTATLDSLIRVEATIAYDTELGRVVIDDGTSLTPVHGLPDSFGSAGQLLSTNGVDTTSWVDAAVPSGTANRMAVFDGSGNLVSSAFKINNEGAAPSTLAFGFEQNGTVTAPGIGSLAHGICNSGGSGAITSTADGSSAMGRIFASGNIIAAGTGSMAGGVAGQATIETTGQGSLAWGCSQTAGAQILASGTGSIALGNTDTYTINVSGIGALGGGDGSAGAILVDGGANGAFTWGQANAVHSVVGTALGFGQNVNSYATTAVGRYASATGTPDSWVSTDPLFVVGNGTADGARSNALQVNKDGSILMGNLYAVAPTGTSDPTAPEGSVYYNTATHKLRLYNGSAWVSLN